MAARAWFILALVVALVVFVLLDGGAAAARPPSTTQQQRQQVQSLLRRLNKPPLATIQSPDGDIIDCVHISKQPAFDHPLLKNHTIQMRPFSYPRDLHNGSNIVPQPITQTWHQNGRQCPENTIPVRRTKEEDVLRASSISMFGKKRPGSIPNHNSFEQSVTSGHQWAVASSSADRYYGTKASFNLWQPNIERSGDFSLTQTWITKGSYGGNDLNTIEAGWQVYPVLYGDRNPRLFIYWTRDAYQNTGCYNLWCSGFVQTNNQIAIGGSLSPVSTYSGSQYAFSILIWKDQQGGNWWMQVGGYVLGYWPSSIFTYLADSASSVDWGGEVYSDPNAGQSATQMGSGHFPEEWFGKASFIRNIQVVNPSNCLQSPSGVSTVEQRNCYNVQNYVDSNWGTYIFYGGPGRNPNCP